MPDEVGGAQAVIKLSANINAKIDFVFIIITFISFPHCNEIQSGKVSI